MTRRDYVILAAALREARLVEVAGRNAGMPRNAVDGVTMATAKVVTVLEKENPFFDSDRFIAAVMEEPKHGD
jgi:hypothetical protein